MKFIIFSFLILVLVTVAVRSVVENFQYNGMDVILTYSHSSKGVAQWFVRTYGQSPRNNDVKHLEINCEKSIDNTYEIVIFMTFRNYPQSTFRIFAEEIPGDYQLFGTSKGIVNQNFIYQNIA